MQILGLFGMYFNCFVVEIEKSLIFSQIGYGHTCCALCYNCTAANHFSQVEIKKKINCPCGTIHTSRSNTKTYQLSSFNRLSMKLYLPTTSTRWRPWIRPEKAGGIRPFFREKSEKTNKLPKKGVKDGHNFDKIHLPNDERYWREYQWKFGCQNFFLTASQCNNCNVGRL